jgi:erythromycin esterase-like protein
MVYRLFILISLSVFWASAGAQQPVDLIRKYSTPVRSIAPNDSDYTDLEPIAKAIGDARIVMLGEMDNGDGETIRAKTRLVQYLHQKLGFTVLAFESDFNGVNWLWETQKSGYAALRAVTHIWTDVAEFREMERYIARYSHGPDPLFVAGIDCQIYDAEEIFNFTVRAPKLFEALGYDVKDPVYPDYITSLVRANDYDTAKRLTDTTIRFLRNQTVRILNDLKERPELDPTGLWYQTFNNLMGNAANCWLNRNVPVGYNFLQLKHDGTLHEKQMADNLRWLADERYKGKKIIVWALNRHITKNIDQLDVRISNYRRGLNTTLGAEAFRRYGNDLYILGFTSALGSSGSPFQRDGMPFDIHRLGKNDLYTNTMLKTKADYAFTDFRPIQNTADAAKPFISRGWGYEYDMKGNWFNVFDGLFFIKTNKAAIAMEFDNLAGSNNP